jgi:SprT-like family
MNPTWFRWAVEVDGDPAAIQRAHDMAVDLMARWGVQDWELRIGHGKDQAGSYRFRCVPGTRVWDGNPGKLILSGPLMSLWTEEQQRDTILHEIAHILCPDDYHGPMWRAQCRRIGAKPVRCWGEDGEKRVPPTVWAGECPGGHQHRQRVSRKNPGPKWWCTRCSPVYDERYVVTWRKVTS